jgi:hypothetical protein
MKVVLPHHFIAFDSSSNEIWHHLKWRSIWKVFTNFVSLDNYEWLKLTIIRKENVRGSENAFN